APVMHDRNAHAVEARVLRGSSRDEPARAGFQSVWGSSHPNPPFHAHMRVEPVRLLASIRREGRPFPGQVSGEGSTGNKTDQRSGAGPTATLDRPLIRSVGYAAHPLWEAEGAEDVGRAVPRGRRRMVSTLLSVIPVVRRTDRVGGQRKEPDDAHTAPAVLTGAGRQAESAAS